MLYFYDYTRFLRALTEKLVAEGEVVSWGD